MLGVDALAQEGEVVMISLGEVGPFFALTQLDADEVNGTAWESLSVGLQAPLVVGQWRDRVSSHFAQGLGVSCAEINESSISSAIHLGLCARVISPFLALAALRQPVSVPRWDQLHWQYDGTTQFPLGMPTQAAQRPVDAQDVRSLTRALIDLDVVPSLRVKWGNAASAMNGACIALRTWRPDVGEQAARLADAILNEAPFSTHTGGMATPEFRRQSCCLLYALTPQTRGMLCGDCVLT